MNRLASSTAFARFGKLLGGVCFEVLSSLRPTPAIACSCAEAPGKPRVYPNIPPGSAQGREAPLNTRLVVMGKNVDMEGMGLFDPQGNSVELELGDTYRPVSEQGQDCVSVVEWIPPRLRSRTRYEIWYGRDTTPLGEFTTGTVVDEEAPSPVRSMKVNVMRGNFGTSCDYGQPRVDLRLNGAHDRLTPDDLLLFRVKVAALTSGSYEGSESLFHAWPNKDAQWVALAAGSEYCGLRNFFFPPPLLPAQFTVTAVDMAGNESAPIQVGFTGPHTAMSFELVERLGKQKLSQSHLSDCYSTAPKCRSCPALPKPREWVVPVLVGLAFTVGLGAGALGKRRRLRRPPARAEGARLPGAAPPAVPGEDGAP